MQAIKQNKANSHGVTFEGVVMSAFNLPNQRHMKIELLGASCWVVEILQNGEWVEYGAVDHGEYVNFVESASA